MTEITDALQDEDLFTVTGILQTTLNLLKLQKIAYLIQTQLLYRNIIFNVSMFKVGHQKFLTDDAYALSDWLVEKGT